MKGVIVINVDKDGLMIIFIAGIESLVTVTTHCVVRKDEKDEVAEKVDTRK